MSETKLKQGDVLYTANYPHSAVTIRAVKNKYLYLEGHSDDYKVDIKTLAVYGGSRLAVMTEAQAVERNKRHECTDKITTFIYRNRVGELSTEQLAKIAGLLP